jgi:hypothetical protein
MRNRRRIAPGSLLGPLFFLASILLPIGAALYLILLADPPIPTTSAVLSTVNNVVEVQGVNQPDFREAQEQQVLVSGDGVRTSDEGRGVITFVDESSIVLEPDSELRILPPRRSGGGLINRFSQSFGTSWSQLSSLAGGNYDIATPAGVISVRDGAILRVGVGQTQDGRSTVQVVVVEGEAEVRPPEGQGGAPVVVSAGETVRAVEGEAIPEPEPFVPDNDVIIRLFSPFWMLVTEPVSGLSTGLIPPGFALRQIPLSSTTAAGAEPQTVRLNEITPGNYTIYLLPKGDGGAFTVTAQGSALSAGIFSDARDGQTIGCEWFYLILTVDLDDDGLLNFGALQGPFPLPFIPGVVGNEVDSDCPPPSPITAVGGAQATPTAEPLTPTPPPPGQPTAEPPPPEQPTAVATATPVNSPTPLPTEFDSGEIVVETPVPTQVPEPTPEPTPRPPPDIGIGHEEEEAFGLGSGLPVLLAMAPGAGYAFISVIRRRGGRP